MSEYQKAIIKRIDIFLIMFSNLLIVITNESSFNKKTNNEIDIVVPELNKKSERINKNITKYDS